MQINHENIVVTKTNILSYRLFIGKADLPVHKSTFKSANHCQKKQDC